MRRLNPLMKIALPALALALAAGAITARERQDSMDKKDWRKLTKEEAHVIEDKGTELPFTGAYYRHKEEGSYHCRRCGAPLFVSDSKFDSGCGWPSFDDAIQGAVEERPDADGLRMEIVCARCDGHLGHVFRGEGATPKNTRHCVNSLSIDFKPEASAPAAAKPPKVKEAYFAGGCFWGVEHLLQALPGVLSVTSGYMGGTVERPSYRAVTTGRTHHAETVRVAYDPARVGYETLAKLFFEIHDPTQVGRQGPDVGNQYRSAVFVSDAEERAVVERLVETLKKRGLAVATEVVDADHKGPGGFWEAEPYHQDYYERSGKQPYCHSRVRRFE
jgi:peptide methionine sulfoxide reductase msrA/msrB